MQELEKVPTNTPEGKHRFPLTTSGSDEDETWFIGQRVAVKMLRRCLIPRFDPLHISAAPRGAAVLAAEGRGRGPGGHEALR